MNSLKSHFGIVGNANALADNIKIWTGKKKNAIKTVQTHFLMNVHPLIIFNEFELSLKRVLRS